MMLRYLLPVLLLLAAQASLAAAGAAAPKPQPQQFKDWAKLCERTPENKESCYIYQSVTRKDDNQLLMNIRVGYSSKPGSGPLVIVTVPTGVLLPPGAALMVVADQPLTMPFLTCTPKGCITVATPLNDATVQGMKTGTQASVRVANTQKKVVGIPISLSGFTKAFNSLPPPK